MKPTFFKEMCFAAIVTFLVALLGIFRFALFISFSYLLAAVTGIYILRIISTAQNRAGIFLLALFSVAAVMLIAMAPSMGWSSLLIATGAVWFVRITRRYHSLALPIMDGILSLFAFVSSLVCFQYTHSLAVSLGIFFLVHGLSVYLPSSLDKRERENCGMESRVFEEAYRRAETILHGRF